jgi:glycosyltransferase involved in cell wall biosynthesis
MKRILVLGGTANSLVNFRGHFLTALVRCGHEVIAAAGGNDPGVAKRLEDMGVHYVPVHLNRTSLSPGSAARSLIDYWKLIRRVRPDVILAYTVKPVVFGLMAAKLSGITNRYALITGLGHAFIPDGSLRQRIVGHFVPMLYRASLRGCAGVLFQNGDDERLFFSRRILSRKALSILVPGSGVDTDRFSPAPLPDGQPIFLLIGRLLGEKGVREFARAAVLVKRDYPQVRFALLGPFDMNPSAVSKAELDEWCRAGTVEYWGDTDDVRPFISRATVIVLPSYREGMPRSVLEGMAMGRAIVTSNAPGCRETVEEGANGFLVDVKDVAGLAAAMSRFLADPTLAARMGSESRKRAVRMFDVIGVTTAMMRAMNL